MLASRLYPPTGVAQIDAEHREIAELAEQLDAAAFRDDGERAARLAAELEQAVIDHFATEERLMDEIAYRDRERHLAAHRRYLAGMRGQVESLSLSGLTPALLRWSRNLDAWFRLHVIEEDLWLGTAVVDAGRR